MSALWLILAVTAAAGIGMALANLFEDEVPWRARFTTALAVLVPAGLAPSGADPAFVMWTMILAVLLAALSAIDLTSRTVPDLLSIPLILLGLGHAWMRGLSVGTMAATVAVVIVAALIVARIPSRLRKGIGGGDVLLLAGALAWLGPTVALDLLILVPAILIPLWFFFRSDEGLPAAPAFAAATLLFWLNGPVF